MTSNNKLDGLDGRVVYYDEPLTASFTIPGNDEYKKFLEEWLLYMKTTSDQYKLDKKLRKLGIKNNNTPEIGLGRYSMVIDSMAINTPVVRYYDEENKTEFVFKSIDDWLKKQDEGKKLLERKRATDNSKSKGKPSSLILNLVNRVIE